MVHLTHPLQEDESLPGGSYELLEKMGLHQNTRLDKIKIGRGGTEAAAKQKTRVKAASTRALSIRYASDIRSG